ncbi:hypothetical protein [Dietzia cinnamea]|uniref:hypothetical protein n=1 Tax=Dietzia cinnamea TaxID=321318 RepID=UPI0021A8C55D|nr:hypothetical protein [Dietzia cinnamea]MCT2121564.1 hypothetical protein [Dietzia cinnamea]
MITFLTIVGGIVWFLAAVTIIAVGGILTIGFCDDGDYGLAAASVVGAVLAFAVAIWVALATGIIASDDNAKHCGPGTTYRESSRYDPATKTVRTDWVCEANR